MLLIIFAADVPVNPVELSQFGILKPPDDAKLIAEAIYFISKKTDFELQEVGKLGYNYIVHNYNILAEKYLDVFEN